MGSIGVEGEWKGFIFSIGIESDEPEICALIRDNYLEDEPIKQYMEWSVDIVADHNRVIHLAVTQGLSFVIRDQTTQEVVGANLVLDSRLPGVSTLFSTPGNQMSPEFKTLSAVLDQGGANAEQTIKDRFPSEFHAFIHITSVARNYRRRGIATETYVRLLTLLKSRGFPMLHGLFSNPATRRIASNLGFEEVGRVYLQDATNENGEKLRRDLGQVAAGEEKFFIITAMPI